MERTLWEKEINGILEEIKPALEAHGGGAQLASIEGNTIVLTLQGSCHGCPMSSMTFGIMVEDLIRERIPEIEKVVYE